MVRRILTALTFIAATCLTPTMQATASARIEISDMEVPQQIRIEQKGNSVVVHNAVGKVAHIYNLIGVEIMTVKIDAAEKRIDLSHLKKGIYPVKVEKVSKKANISGR